MGKLVGRALERREDTRKPSCLTQAKEIANSIITQYLVTNVVFFYEIMRTIQIWGTVGNTQTKEMCPGL